MNDTTLMIITVTIMVIIAILIIIYVINKNKNKSLKKQINRLEIEKNIIDSTPIMPELSKIESFLNIKNDKLEILYNDWKDRLTIIKTDHIPKVTDMLIETDYSLAKMDYKTALYKIAQLEMEIYRVKENSNVLLEEIKEITTSEERNRAIVTKFKSRYRELYQKFIDTKSEYFSIAKPIILQFENIAKRFEDFETIMENNEFTEVTKIIKAIDEMLNHMEVVINEVPTIILTANTILPKKIEETIDLHNQLIKEGYQLDYLNVEENIKETNYKVKDILDRAKVLNLEDSIFELKILLEYFDTVYADFEKERNERSTYENGLNVFNNRLNEMNKLLADIFIQIDDIKTVYNLSTDDLILLNQVNEQLKTLNSDYKLLLDHTRNNAFPYSQLTKEIDFLSSRLNNMEDRLSNSLDVIGSMKEDEVRARQQLEEIKIYFKDAKRKMEEYNFPFIPQYYYVQLKEANDAIKEVVIELGKKPITIKVLNTRVDTARDLVLKLCGSVKELLEKAKLAEMIIVYGNRYRSEYNEIDRYLNASEILFNKGDYNRSVEVSINALNSIDSTIYEKIQKLSDNTLK